MEYFKIMGIAIIGLITVTCLPIKEKSISSIISISVCCLIFLIVIKNITPQIEIIKSFADSQFTSDIGIVFKIMGICLITQIVSDISIDLGYKSISNAVIFTGNIAILYIALPIYVQVLDLIGKILE